MLKTITAIVFSAIVAGAITGFPDFVGPVSATSTNELTPVAAPTCPARGWPYRDCSEGVTAVRLITTDRLH